MGADTNEDLYPFRRQPHPLYAALDEREARVKELEAALLTESERAEMLAKEADSYRVRYEASQEALRETQGELREVGDILGASETESTIDAARRVMGKRSRGVPVINRRTRPPLVIGDDA